MQTAETELEEYKDKLLVPALSVDADKTGSSPSSPIRKVRRATSLSAGTSEPDRMASGHVRHEGEGKKRYDLKDDSSHSSRVTLAKGMKVSLPMNDGEDLQQLLIARLHEEEANSDSLQLEIDELREELEHLRSISAANSSYHRGVREEKLQRSQRQ